MSYMRVICVLLAQCSLPPTLQWTQKFVFATFQCSRTIQCMVTQEGPLSSGGWPCSRTIQCMVTQEGPLSSGGWPCSRTIQCIVTQEGPLSSGGWSCSRTIQCQVTQEGPLSSGGCTSPVQPHYPVPGYPGGPTFQWGLYFSSTAALSSAQLPLSSGHGIFQCQKCPKKHAKFRDYVTITHELFARPTPPPFRVL